MTLYWLSHQLSKWTNWCSESVNWSIVDQKSLFLLFSFWAISHILAVLSWLWFLCLLSIPQCCQYKTSLCLEYLFFDQFLASARWFDCNLGLDESIGSLVLGFNSLSCQALSQTDFCWSSLCSYLINQLYLGFSRLGNHMLYGSPSIQTSLWMARGLKAFGLISARSTDAKNKEIQHRSTGQHWITLRFHFDF